MYILSTRLKQQRLCRLKIYDLSLLNLYRSGTMILIDSSFLYPQMSLEKTRMILDKQTKF